MKKLILTKTYFLINTKDNNLWILISGRIYTVVSSMYALIARLITSVQNVN